MSNIQYSRKEPTTINPLPPTTTLTTKPTIHLPHPPIIPPNTTLPRPTIPALPAIRKPHRILIRRPSRRNQHQRQRARNADALPARRVVVVDLAHELFVVIFEHDREAVVGCGLVAVRGEGAFVFLVLWGGGLGLVVFMYGKS